MNAQGGDFSAAVAIARRDLLEFVRDRRTLFITLLLPMAVYPILALSTALGVRTAAVEIEAERAPTALALVVTGPDAAPFAGRLKELFDDTPPASRTGWPAAITLELVTEAEARRKLAAGTADLWIAADADLVGTLDGQGTAVLRIEHPPEHPPAPRVREQFDALARSLAADARGRRVAAAGLPASLLDPLEVRSPPIAAGAIPPKSILGTVAGGVLVLLAVLTMTGAFYPAIDAIAGEKERGTIETLLIAPCTAGALVAGKFLAVFAVTLATLAANVVSLVATTTVAARLMPAGLSLTLAGGVAGPLAVLVIAFTALAALSAAMSLAVTTASRSMKEAQNTLTPVILLVSALAGTALVPGLRAEGVLPAVPFTGQVLVARAAIGSAETAPLDAVPPVTVPILGPLLLTLASAGVLTWLLLTLTAALLTDEEILFRGPDAAPHGLRRPAPRTRPTPAQGLVTAAAGLTLLWYAQGFVGIDPTQAGVAAAAFGRGLLAQQALAVLVPLVVAAWWQRVDARATFGWRWPAVGGPVRAVGVTLAAALVGVALFAAGATALLAVRGTEQSPEARLLSEQLFAFVTGSPWWLAALVIAVVPAICEELLFRGWLLAALAGATPTRGRAAAALGVQAACFAAFHLLPERMPQTFLLGLVAGGLTLATRSLLPAVACHLAHNATPLVLLALSTPPG
jgi:sodium transport system permease protein